MLEITPSGRLRPSPFFEVSREEGMVSATVYNSMILPTGYGNPEEEYWRLINGVSQWDVGAERQVQLKGPDAGVLAQILSPRDLSKCKIGQGKYVPLCDHRGTLMNDPIVLKLADDLYWYSIADSDMWLWARSIAYERGLDVEVSEPDVAPMALQGPMAEDVVAHVFGDWVRDIKYFWFKETHLEGIPVAVQRSGWSKQGGFEIYLRDGTQGRKLWNIFKEAGKAWDIGPGSPGTPERVESGLLSVGGDTDDKTNPFDVRLGKYVDVDMEFDGPGKIVGLEALRKIHGEGNKRHQLGIIQDGDTPDPLQYRWADIKRDDREDGPRVGRMTVCVWSPRMKQNIGYALVEDFMKPGDKVVIYRESGRATGTLVDLPFL
ncbi:MAG: glycine cleavage T C-terminal barrel domain-containing protein [Pseudomonadota bacterium]